MMQRPVALSQSRRMTDGASHVRFCSPRCVLGIVAGFVLFLFPDLLPVDTAVVTVFGFLAILAGFITLISRLRNTDEDRGPDDGAVV